MKFLSNSCWHTRITTQLCSDCSEQSEHRKRFNGEVIFCILGDNSAGSSMTWTWVWSGCFARICRSTTHLYVPCWWQELHSNTRTGAKFGGIDVDADCCLSWIFFGLILDEWVSLSLSSSIGFVGTSESCRMIFTTFDSAVGCLRAWCFL